jgi:hypothetical protein
MVRDVREELYPLKKHCCIGILAQEAALSSIPNQRLQVSVMSHLLGCYFFVSLAQRFSAV